MIFKFTRRRPNSFLHRALFFTAFMLGALLFVGLAAAASVVYCNGPPPLKLPITGDGITLEEAGESSGAVIRFDVRRGESAQSVGQRLVDAGIIRNRYFWAALCRFDPEPVKTGTYRLELPAGQMAIHRILVSGRQILMRVTVPEGLTLKKTARLLEEAGVCPAEDFLAAAFDPTITALYQIPGGSMEGYLFPDTYLFPPEYPASKVIQAMTDNFFAKIGEVDERALNMPPEELNKLVILASIIEREYRLDEEAPVMAGVFLNRLNIGMALQSCATVEYVITEIQGKPHPEVLLTRDTEIRDPYNTYIRPGLPPGPICAPGAVALAAVFSPAENSYLYFRLVDPDSGRHYFSNTLDDHIRAGTLYLKGGP
ncbi:MAG: endolytic transglycosylase MltG [Treponema sp.]|nr:endolytic transglycosylase MltG [Treponema sp.]